MSRAYYAAYNVTVSLLEGMGFAIPASGKSHKLVRDFLHNAGDVKVEGCAQKLAALYDWRVKADYRMSNRHIEDARLARSVVGQASGIIEELRGATSDAERRNSIEKAIGYWTQTGRAALSGR